MMHVWKCEDWMWRLAAITGLVYVLSMVYFLGIECAYWSLRGGPPGSGLGPDAKDIATVIGLGLLVICCWLAMLRWSRAAWLWGAICGLPFVFLLAWIHGASTGLHHWDQLPDLGYAVVLTAALMSSQVWLIWETQRVAERPPDADRLLLPGNSCPVWDQAGWTWRAFALGGVTAGLSLSVWLVCAAISHFLRTLGHPDLPYPVESVFAAGETIVAVALAGVIALAWTSLVATGRGFLFWLLWWGLALLICSHYVGRKYLTVGGEEWRISVGLVFVLALLSVSVSQIWVAWKARTLGIRLGEASTPESVDQ